MFSEWLKSKVYLNFSKIIIFSIIYLYLAMLRTYCFYRAFKFLILMSAHCEKKFMANITLKLKPGSKCHQWLRFHSILFDFFLCKNNMCVYISNVSLCYGKKRKYCQKCFKNLFKIIPSIYIFSHNNETNTASSIFVAS
jgi:hypothetical protein